MQKLSLKQMQETQGGFLAVFLGGLLIGFIARLVYVGMTQD